jgi:carbon storage regulator CsrA
MEAGTMLVLSRRKGEQIIIGDSVLTLLDTSRGRVRIGIEAPDDVSVVCAELRDERLAEEYASEVSGAGESSNSGECFKSPSMNPR